MNTRNHKQKQKPAKTSSKATGRSRWSKERREQMQEQALMNAVGQDSTANYKAIIEGFAARGIPVEQIVPRENVFTFNAWKALGRVVRKGEHGVQIVTVIPCTKKLDEEGQVKVPTKKVKRTTVFHITQTDALQPAPSEELEQVGQVQANELQAEDEEDPELAQARAAGFGCVAAWKNPNWFSSVVAHSQAFAEELAKEDAGQPADFSPAFALLDAQSVEARA